MEDAEFESNQSNQGDRFFDLGLDQICPLDSRESKDEGERQLDADWCKSWVSKS